MLCRRGEELRESVNQLTRSIQEEEKARVQAQHQLTAGTECLDQLIRSIGNTFRRKTAARSERSQSLWTLLGQNSKEMLKPNPSRETVPLKGQTHDLRFLMSF